MFTTINTHWEAAQRVIAAKLTRLTHKIELQLYLAAESLPFAVLAPGGQSGNFWIHPRTKFSSPSRILHVHIISNLLLLLLLLQI